MLQAFDEWLTFWEWWAKRAFGTAGFYIATAIVACALVILTGGGAAALSGLIASRLGADFASWFWKIVPLCISVFGALQGVFFFAFVFWLKRRQKKHDRLTDTFE